MENSSNSFIFPAEKFKILSGSALKTIAILTMLTDHIGFHVVGPLCTENASLSPLYDVLRTIGRIAFPIYCFLLTEGFTHTRDRKKYGINLLAFALISELPWNLVHAGDIIYPAQNVFFTLFLGYLGMCAIEYLENMSIKQSAALIGLLLVSFFIHADYGISGYGFIIALYALRNSKAIQAITCTCIIPSGLKGGLAFIPINMYNGKRGFIKGKAAKYFFYAFYPIHLAVLFFIKYFIIYS